MSIFRINKDSNYTVMSNHHFREKEMSLKAKGLLSLMLSLPDDWDYSIAGLVTLSADGESSVRTALTELEKFGYLKRTRERVNGKLDGVIYDIYEKPLNVDFQQQENLNVEKLKQEKLILENQGQLNTNKINNLNNKKTKEIDIGNFGKSKLPKKFKILEKIPSLALEYDIEDDEVLDLLEEFFKVNIEAGNMVNEYTIKGSLDKLAKVNKQKQIKTIKTGLERGWKNLNPEWLKSNNSNQEHLQLEGKSQEEHLEYLQRLKESKSTVTF